MRLVNIASGSSGNCTYIGDDKNHILIDAGISRKRIEEGLNAIGLTLKDINAILITHEHTDHIGGLGVISRKDEIPMYATNGTIKGIVASKSTKEIDKALFNVINYDKSFYIGGLRINPFRISHDAYEPAAFTVESGKKKTGVITDLGKYDDYIVSHLYDMDSVMVEANHDIHMLETGPYSYQLKMRVLSDRGHLSNDSCARMLGKILCDKTGCIMLGHLSKENNYDKLALMTVMNEIDLNETGYKAKDFEFLVARPDALVSMKEF